MKTKKVLIVYHYIAHYRIPIFNLLSKSEDPNYQIISGLEAEIGIQLADKNLAKLPLVNGGLKWIQIKNYWIFNLFLWQPEVLKFVRKKEYDTIIFLGTMYYISTWLGAVFAKLYGKKVIFWSHGYIKKEKNVKGYIRKLFYSLADEMLVYGQWAKEILIAKGFKNEKIKLIYNSLDYDRQKKIRLEENIDLNLFNKNFLPTFGFIGRITKQKKLHLLIETLDKLVKDKSECNLLIVGEGNELSSLKEMVNKLNLNDFVVFTGASFDELYTSKLLSQIDVVVSPGEVGLTAIHAMSYGIPVITHNRFDMQMPEFESIIPGETGDFFDYDRPIESLALILHRWLFEKNKTESREKCYGMIDNFYNPHAQLRIFNSVV